MPETYNDDLWREAEQDDSSSSMDSYLYLESSEDSEIITVPAEHVPRVPYIVPEEHVPSVPEVDRTFLRERIILAAMRLDLEDMLRWVEGVQAIQQDGGALPQDGGALQHVDETVDTQDPDAVDTQALDTDTTPAPRTAPIQYTDDTVDIVDTRAPDIQDTQATH